MSNIPGVINDKNHQKPGCCVKDPFTDPNNARFKTFGHLQNYSRYECDSRPFDANRFFIMGARNPPCDISYPFYQTCKTNDIEYMSKCDTFQNYNRNGKFVGSIYGERVTNKYV
jgi:hypothetical protein